MAFPVQIINSAACYASVCSVQRDGDGQATCPGGPLRWRVPLSPWGAGEELALHGTVVVVLPRGNTKEESVLIRTRHQLGPFLCAQGGYNRVVIQSPAVAVAGKTSPVSFIKRYNIWLWPGGLVGALSHKRKGQGFDSQSGLIPRSWVGPRSGPV